MEKGRKIKQQLNKREKMIKEAARSAQKYVQPTAKQNHGTSARVKLLARWYELSGRIHQIKLQMKYSQT